MTNREKKLVLVLPAVAVIGAYGYFFLTPKFREVSAAEKELDQLKGQAAPNATDDRAKLTAIAREIEADAKSVEALRKRWDAAVGRTGAPLPGRPERIARLNQLLDRAGLQIIDGSDSDAAKGGSLHPGIDALAKEIGDGFGQPPPRVRVVRFHGRYGEVAAAMRTLAGGTVAAIPLGLTMKPDAATPNLLEWTLHVWV